MPVRPCVMGNGCKRKRTDLNRIMAPESMFGLKLWIHFQVQFVAYAPPHPPPAPSAASVYVSFIGFGCYSVYLWSSERLLPASPKFQPALYDNVVLRPHSNLCAQRCVTQPSTVAELFLSQFPFDSLSK